VWAAVEVGSDARTRLADAVLACYSTLVAPYWLSIHARLQAERAVRARIMMDGGVDGLLSTLHPPRVRWRPPVLEVDSPCQLEIDLGGRGLTLVPSVFIGAWSVVTLDQPPGSGQRVRLVFPASPDLSARIHLWDGGRSAGMALSALIGRTRAVMLGSIGDGCTTSQLASRAGVSVAAASQHATVLRAAGLITTRRNGVAVLHALTPLGTELLTGNGTPAERTS
jgi:DNA-binding transcriptional ArsR family regulator